MQRFILLLSAFFLAAATSAQTMTFNSGASEPGFTFGGWAYDGGLDLVYPTTPNVNWTGWISHPGGCWNALSFNPQCFAPACGFPSGTTWRVFSDQGDEVFFQIPSNTTTYIELNFVNINTLYFQIETLGDGSPNQTWNLDNVSYLVPEYIPAAAPELILPIDFEFCPGETASMYPFGELNSAYGWYVYEDACGEGEGQIVFGDFEAVVNETTSFFFRGEDPAGCTAPGPCTEVVVVVLEPDGCTDPDACNFDMTATCDDGSCTYPQWYLPFELGTVPAVQACEAPAGYYLANQACAEQIVSLDFYCIDTSWDVICNQAYSCCMGEYSCHDLTACNYDNTLCSDFTLCVYPGCTNPLACNYDASAGCDDGSCNLPDGCTDPTACNYEAAALCDNGSCIYPQWYLPNNVGEGPIVQSCDPLPGYFLANQFCAAEVVLNDPYCVETNWDDLCSAAYNCCTGNYACHDPTACNYDINLCEDPSLCVYPGCTDPAACNYDATAGCDDGSCTLPDGCTDATACNYEPAALCDDQSCIYGYWHAPLVIEGGPMVFTCTPPVGYYLLPDQACAEWLVEFDSYCPLNNWDQICLQKYNLCLGNEACHDTTACDYNLDYWEDTTLCTYPGCTNISACNYDPTAACDNGTCEYLTCRGCTGQMACNYNPAASIDDGSCEYESCSGCTYVTAVNYQSSAVLDDGSCLFPMETDCSEDLDGDTMIGTNDLLILLGAFGASCP